MKDLTLILLIKDRPEFFERWVDYTIMKKPNFNFLISDGGKKKIDKKFLAKLSFNNIKFKYKKFKYDNNYIQFCKKIFQSVKMCKSKYVALFADDDLYICSSISKGIDFLNKNEKYVCWGGKIILFGASNKYDTINSIPYNFSEMYSGREINFKSTSLEKRIFFYIKNPNAVIFHHMFRREALLHVYKKVLRSDLKIPNIIDLYSNSLSYCLGLVKTGNQIANDVHTTCYYPSYQFLIDWNGDVFLCPQDWQRRQTMGNMMQEEVFDIWTSKIMKKYRVDLLQGKRSNNPCKNCNAQGTLLGGNHAQKWKEIYKV
jgi:glycosyltransferase domain-containing protein/radical SAM protein with 4Fe4S-binding SPASM domain